MYLFNIGTKSNLYGKQRCWGAVRWGVFSIFAGCILNSSEINKNYLTENKTGKIFFGKPIILKQRLEENSLKGISLLFFFFFNILMECDDGGVTLNYQPAVNCDTTIEYHSLSLTGISSIARVIARAPF